MNAFLLEHNHVHGGGIALDVSDNHPGSILINCPEYDTIGILPPRLGGRPDVELVVVAIDRSAAGLFPELQDGLDDIEQAGTVLLASVRMQDAVNASKLSGIEFIDPVGYVIGTQEEGAEELIRQCKEVFQFKAIHVTGRGGSIAKSSGVRLVKACEVCGWREWSLPENGIHVDEDQWDGLDFFYVDEWGSMLMSDRAVRALMVGNLSNFGAAPAAEYRPWWIKKEKPAGVLSKEERKRMRRELENG